MTMTETAAKAAVKIRKSGGDDRYSWALFIHGRRTYAGMDQSEARWRRKREIARLMAEGRDVS